MSKDRRQSVRDVRVEAADTAYNRDHPQHLANPDERRYAAANYPMSFTKGLEHDPDLGVVANRAHFEAFRQAIDGGDISAFTRNVPVPPNPNGDRRKWEAPTAGVVYDLEGPDAQAVTMAPAPELGSDELAFEMAEVYELALLRDVRLLSFDQGGGSGSAQLNESLARLNAGGYAQAGFPNRPRKNEGGSLTRQTAFRGSSPGVEKGPYVSQFLWVGTNDPSGAGGLLSGEVAYGAQSIDQKVPVADPGQDYMQLWADWLEVQNGFDVNGCAPGQTFDGTRRFIYTPRDLATYVHFDALYQAYLNATLILLGMGTPFDPSFAHLSGQYDEFEAGVNGGIKPNTTGFALYGGPHILTLVTEVATRALKAVRYQKFNNHLRLRPEALAGRVHRSDMLDTKSPSTCGAFNELRNEIGDTVAAVEAFNDAAISDPTALLPMAFQEGSPMHPTYGAGHATVAGACVTVVKAFFDTGTVLGANDEGGCFQDQTGFYRKISAAKHVEPIKSGAELAEQQSDCALTLEGELNKLAANISIGRNMAGVHYFSDYYDSLRMGEEIAIGLLEEQALCYQHDDFVLSVPTFDGGLVRIGRQ
ncbi:MAG: vanadium-dependent haloperoxidase [Acidimicrobiales bacterium]